MADDRIQRFQAVAGDAKHGGIVGRNFAGGNQFLGHADGDAAGGFGEDAFAFGQQLDAFANFVVGDVFGGSRRFPS